MQPGGHVPGPKVDPEVFERRTFFFMRAIGAWLVLGAVAVALVPSGWGGYACVASLVGLAATSSIIEWLVRRPK